MAFNTFPTSSPWPPLDLANDLNDNFSKTVEVSLSTNPADGAVLVYDASADIWTDGQETVTLDDLTNVVLATAPTDGSMLVYNASSDIWEDATTVTIEGGTIDGATIGGTTPAAISGTTGTFSGDIKTTGGDIVIETAIPRLEFIETDTTDALARIFTAGGSLYIDCDRNDTDPSNIIIRNGGTNERMRIDSNGRVGIGTSSLGASLVVADLGTVFLESAAPQIRLYDTDSGTSAYGQIRTDTLGSVRFFGDGGNNSGSGSVQFGTGSTEHMRIDSTGNVGIGTSSPAIALDVNGSIRTSNGSGGTFTAYESDGTRGNRLRIGADANGGFVTTTFNTGGSTDIRFVQASSEVMRIDSNGRVGIGTSSPSRNLEISGTSPLSRITDSSSTISSGFAVNEFNGSDGSVGYVGLNSGSLALRTTAAYPVIIATNNANDIIFNTNSSEAMRIDSSGNVGIGTTSPTEELEISASAPTISLDDNDGAIGSGFGVVEFNCTDGRFGFMGMNGGSLQMRTDGSNSLSFAPNATSRMTILPTGEVGIGTSSPDNVLHVASSSASIRLEDTDGTGPVGIFTADTVGSIVYNADPNNAGTNTNHRWQVDGSEVMRLDVNGDLGIGTNNPDSRLDVNGAITQRPLSADPADPDSGNSVMWVSDGTGSGDAGDVMLKINVGGTTKTITLVDYSAS